MELLDHDVTVGLGVIGNWAAQNTRFDIAWVSGLSTEKVLVCHDAQSCCILARLPLVRMVVFLKQIHSHLLQQIWRNCLVAREPVSQLTTSSRPRAAIF